MKTMFLLVAVVLAIAGAAQAGNPIQSSPVVVRIADPPTFLVPAPQCPAERSHVQLLSRDGHQLGTSLLCVQTASFDESTATFTEIGTLTLYLPGGKLETAVTIIDDFTGFPVLTQTLAGSVTGGSGIYLGATGSIAGGGTILFGTDGPQPDLTFTVALD
jgi:hypothetical protein